MGNDTYVLNHPCIGGNVTNLELKMVIQTKSNCAGMQRESNMLLIAVFLPFLSIS